MDMMRIRRIYIEARKSPLSGRFLQVDFADQTARQRALACWPNRGRSPYVIVPGTALVRLPGRQPCRAASYLVTYGYTSSRGNAWYAKPVDGFYQAPRAEI
jgi:hypothetical protein